LTDRGLVPAGGFVAVVFAATRAGAVPAGLVARVVPSATAPHLASPRVAATTAGVLKAMTMKKLKVVGAILISAVALAAVTLSRVTATAQSDPNAPAEQPRPAPLTPGKSDPKPRAGPAEPKVATVIPLTKLDTAATATVLSETFRDRASITTVAGESALLVYASESTTAAIDAILVQLGERPRRKPTLVRLRKMGSAEAANFVTGNIGANVVVTILPVSGESTLVVYGDYLATNAVIQLLQKIGEGPLAAPAAGTPAPRPQKTFTFVMNEAPWKAVVAWYAEASGLPFVGKSTPTGTFTFTPPRADQRYTLEQMTDVLNEALMARQFILIRRANSFTLVPADEKIDPGLVPLVKVDDLATRGRTELVSVVLPLKQADAQPTANLVKSLLGPFGTVSIDQASNTLIVRDTAGNLLRVCETIREIERKP
jgi:type II secretory pathway component GspD/PulD (secretin)